MDNQSITVISDDICSELHETKVKEFTVKMDHKRSQVRFINNSNQEVEEIVYIDQYESFSGHAAIEQNLTSEVGNSDYNLLLKIKNLKILDTVEKWFKHQNSVNNFRCQFTIACISILPLTITSLSFICYFNFINLKILLIVILLSVISPLFKLSYLVSINQNIVKKIDYFFALLSLVVLIIIDIAIIKLDRFKFDFISAIFFCYYCLLICIFNFTMNKNCFKYFKYSVPIIILISVIIFSIFYKTVFVMVIYSLCMLILLFTSHLYLSVYDTVIFYFDIVLITFGTWFLYFYELNLVTEKHNING